MLAAPLFTCKYIYPLTFRILAENSLVSGAKFFQSTGGQSPLRKRHANPGSNYSHVSPLPLTSSRIPGNAYVRVYRITLLQPTRVVCGCTVQSLKKKYGVDLSVSIIALDPLTTAPPPSRPRPRARPFPSRIGRHPRLGRAAAS